MVSKKSVLKFNFSKKPADVATKIGAIFLIEKNNNIRTVQSLASFSFDHGFPKNARLQCHLSDRNTI